MHFAIHFIVQRAQWFFIRTRLKATLQDWGETTANKSVHTGLILFLSGNSWPQKIRLYFSFLEKKKTVYRDAWWAYEDPDPQVECSNWRLFSVYHVLIEGCWTYHDALKCISHFRKGQVPCELYHLLLTNSSSILHTCSLLILHPSTHSSSHSSIHLSLGSKSFPVPHHTSWCIHFLAKFLMQEYEGKW